MEQAEGITSGFLGLLSPDERVALAERGSRRTVRRGVFLFTEGESSEHVVTVLSGRLKVSSYTADGKEVVLAVRGPGDLLGELSALDGEPRSGSVSALETAEVLVVPSARFRDFLEAHSRVAVLLLRMVVGRLRDADRKRVEFGAYDTTARVARRLLELRDRYGAEVAGGVAIDLPITQEELAGWTGASREAVSKALRELREGGLVETRRRKIVLLDPDGLRARVE